MSLEGVVLNRINLKERHTLDDLTHVIKNTKAGKHRAQGEQPLTLLPRGGGGQGEGHEEL